MKNLMVSLKVLFVLLALSSQASAFEGNCKLESRGEDIVLSPVPNQPFGQILDGKSSRGDLIRFYESADKFHVFIKTYSRNADVSTSIPKADFEGGTPLRLSIAVANEEGTLNEWLSCTIKK